jgi:vancomycin resistance protein YoaR
MDRKQRDKTGAKPDAVNPNSRAAIRARAEAEEREKREWIAARMRQEKEEEARRKKEEQQAAAEAKAAKRRKKARAAAERRRSLVKGLRIAAIVAVALVVLLGGLGIYAAHRISNRQTNFPNVYLNGIPVAGLSRAETEKKLAEQGWEDPQVLTLHVKLPMDVSFDLDRCEAGLVMSKEEAADAAFAYGRGDNVIENMSDYAHAYFGQVDLAKEQGELDRDYVRAKAEAAVKEFMDKTAGESYFLDEKAAVLHVVKGAGALNLDVDQLCAAAEEALKGEESELVYEQEFALDLSMPDFDALYETLAVEPVDAHFAEEGFEIVPETKGCTFDVEAAKKLWEKAQPMEEILIPLEILEPERTAKDLEGMLFRDCLGEQTTSYLGSSANRINNINLAAEKINGVILMPGETFSYNDTVGERTWEAGYREAGAYMNGEVVEQIGGGICQVSSTLYCATLYARMTIVDRECHWFRVNYLPPGQDATVNWGSQDFQFKNDREYPIKIVASCNNDKKELTIQIWGTDTDGIYVTMTNEQLYFCDAEYTDVKIGTHVHLYIHYYDADGNLLYTEEGPRSSYHKHDYEIEWPPEKYEKDKQDQEDPEPVVEPGEDPGTDPGVDPGEGGGNEGGGNEGGGDEGGEPGVVVIEDP